MGSAHSQLNLANSKFLCGKFGLKTDLRSHVQYGKSSHGPRVTLKATISDCHAQLCLSFPKELYRIFNDRDVYCTSDARTRTINSVNMILDGGVVCRLQGKKRKRKRRKRRRRRKRKGKTRVNAECVSISSENQTSCLLEEDKLSIRGRERRRQIYKV